VGGGLGGGVCKCVGGHFSILAVSFISFINYLSFLAKAKKAENWAVRMLNRSVKTPISPIDSEKASQPPKSRIIWGFLWTVASLQ